jgi:hypothetical protein
VNFQINRYIINDITACDPMKVRMGFDLEGTDDFDYSIAQTDGKVIHNLVSDIASNNDSVIREVAQKHGINITPLEMVPKTQDETMGPWQDPGPLLVAAEALNKAFEVEESFIIGKDIAGRRVDIRRIQTYKLCLYDIMKFARVAQEKGKKIRFMQY